MAIYHTLLQRKQHQQKSFAVLIDPDKQHDTILFETIAIANEVKVNFFLVGGSLLTSDRLQQTIAVIKKKSSIPVVLFPGGVMHLAPGADAILFLSLISGRNPDLLIGQHVLAAPMLKSMGIETIATGYMIIDGGKPTTVSYISNTSPLPSDKPDIAVATALAGEMLGLQCIYLEAGSGAANPVPAPVIRAVRKNITIPLIVGGGIRSPEQAVEACFAGADVIVVGNAIEQDPLLIAAIAQAIHSLPATKLPHHSLQS
jgi:putative glycerol-1-phosphate prenyltransferase